MIEELSHNFMCLKEQLEKEREISAHEERKNKLLREEIERTNKILRVKNSKYIFDRFLEFRKSQEKWLS